VFQKIPEIGQKGQFPSHWNGSISADKAEAQCVPQITIQHSTNV